MAIAILIKGFYLSYEQWLTQKHHVEPILLVGMEGFFGLLLSLLVLIVAGFIPCSLQ